MAVENGHGVLRVMLGRSTRLLLVVVEFVGEDWCCEHGEGLDDLGVLDVDQATKR